MTYNDITNAPNHAGIYCFRNKINNKYYVGQSIKIRTRLKQHLRVFRIKSYPNIALYRAWEKYGLDNFELIILKQFRDIFDCRVKDQLDKLEKEYIQKYDSYNNGYNSTLGEDAGVLGLKHSEEDKNKIAAASKEHAANILEEKSKDSTNWIKVKNIETNEEYVFKNVHEIEDTLGINRYIVYNCINKRAKIANRKWVLAHYHNEYPDAPKYGTIEYEEIIATQFKYLSNKEEICNYIKENPFCTYGDIKQNFELSKKTFYNYKNELGLVQNQRVNVKVTKEDFIEYYQNHSKDECIAHFNITERRYYKYVAKYINGRDI